VDEVADALGVSRATAFRDWAYARAWSPPRCPAADTLTPPGLAASDDLSRCVVPGTTLSSAAVPPEPAHTSMTYLNPWCRLNYSELRKVQTDA
jgi:hypothetical protein